MIQLTHVLNDPQGLHARPIAAIASKLASCHSDVEIRLGDRTASARDLVGMLGLDARGGDELHITVIGDDEEQTADILRTVLP